MDKPDKAGIKGIRRASAIFPPPVAPMAEQIPQILAQASIVVGDSSGDVEVKKGRSGRRLSVRS